VRATKVYDVEAEGGLRPSARSERQDEPLDLMSAMRERSTARGRRSPGGRRGSPKAPNNVPVPVTTPPISTSPGGPEVRPGDNASSPGAHAEPDPSGVDGRPEPEAAACLTEAADVGLGLEVSSPSQTDNTTELVAAKAAEPVATPRQQVGPKAPAAARCTSRRCPQGSSSTERSGLGRHRVRLEAGC
jgi:hypothetical protein